jgi:hypothetical protein
MSDLAATDSLKTDVGTLKQQLESELSAIVNQSQRRGRFDATLHQFLVILAAFAGFCSLAAGLIWHDKAWIAGVIGAIPSLSSVLMGKLHCLQAASWQRRRAIEVEALRRRLVYEHPETPTRDQIAALSRELGTIEAKLTDRWEAATKTDDVAAAPK